MLKINRTARTLFSPEKANETAAELTKYDCGAPAWEYIAIHAPEGQGLSHVEVRENGELIGYW